MHFCVPVVAMPVGDLPRLIQQFGGWSALTTSAEEFADALKRAVSCDEAPDDSDAASPFDISKIAATFASRHLGHRP